MTLEPNVHRCHDIRCEVRMRCERFIQRNQGAQYTQHCSTLRRGWEPHDSLCERAIKQRLTLRGLTAAGPAGWLVLCWLTGTTPSRIHRKLLRAD